MTESSEGVVEQKSGLAVFLATLPGKAVGETSQTWIRNRSHDIEVHGPSSIVSLVPEQIPCATQYATRYLHEIMRAGVRDIGQLAETDPQTLQINGKPVSIKAVELATHLKIEAHKLEDPEKKLVNNI